ncbi:MAG: hypothetical protein MHMPM18_000511 [Marteilia pararefringens]
MEKVILSPQITLQSLFVPISRTGQTKMRDNPDDKNLASPFADDSGSPFPKFIISDSLIAQNQSPWPCRGNITADGAAGLFNAGCEKQIRMQRPESRDRLFELEKYPSGQSGGLNSQQTNGSGGNPAAWDENAPFNSQTAINEENFFDHFYRGIKAFDRSLDD